MHSPPSPAPLPSLSPGYTGEKPHYDSSWQLAENLDQHSLAEAFKKFPCAADPQNDGDAKMKSEGGEDGILTDLDLDDFSEDEVEESDGEEEQEMNADEFTEEDEEEVVAKKPKDPNVTHLEESDYDSPGKRWLVVWTSTAEQFTNFRMSKPATSTGTVELVLNRRTYRVGQSYYSPGPNPQFIFTISMIKPIPRKALCARYMRMDKCFATPKGKEEAFCQMKDDILVDLTTLKTPCKEAFEIYPMKYEQSEDQRSFSFFNESGSIQYGTRKPAALDLFSGAGGFSLGLNAAGFDVRWAVDNDALAASTLRANKAKSSPGLRVFTEDVKVYHSCLHWCRFDYLTRSHLSLARLRLSSRAPSGVTLVTPNQVMSTTFTALVSKLTKKLLRRFPHRLCTAPCKGFSRANRSKGKGKNDLSNNKQTLLFAKAVKHFKPATCSYENVPTLVSLHKDYLQTIVSQLLQLEYQVTAKVLTASDYGDPQRRRRLILVAARKDCVLPPLPSPTHGAVSLDATMTGLNALLPTKTCKDALKQLEKHEPTTTKTCGSVMLGDTVAFNHVVPRHACTEHDWLLAKDEPSRTILAGAKPHRHYRGDRFVSVREAACLQSFPFDYQFFGGISKQYSQVGNAVPVKLATAVSRCVAKAHDLA